MLVLVSLTLSACVSRDAIDQAVNDPERIEISPASEISFDPSKTWAVIELPSRAVRTGIQIFCDMQGTRAYRPRKSTFSGRCEDQRSFTVGTFDGNVFFSAKRTQLPDGTVLAVYEIEEPQSGEFAPIAKSVNANFPLRVFVDERPVYRFQRGAVHLLSRLQSDEAKLRARFVEAFPDTASRLSGQILRSFQPVCDGSNRSPTCGVGAGAGVRGPVIIQEARDGSRTVLNAEVTPEPEAVSPVKFPVVAGSPPLFEGGKYSDFSPEQISAYCAQDWSARVNAAGRTEYNPCKRRDAFR